MHATPEPPSAPEPVRPAAFQRVVTIRRDYNRWVASETLEDYALRFAPLRFRRWSRWRVAHTAFAGAASFLVLEAVGATLLVQYGFVNACWAIGVTAVLIFLAGVPISVYAARHGVDMDLLTRGAGFGYIGSTITSLIYASFTFIFFALEAAVMAYALELALDIPPTWGYLLCALVVLPLVTHGVSTISRLQLWTQPLWLPLLVLPYAFVLLREPTAFAGITHYGGELGTPGVLDMHCFGAALTMGIALITQLGEQADYLRFMPAPTAQTRGRWWLAVLGGGCGWVLPGAAKMLGGACLAYLAIGHGVPPERAVDPNQMYLAAYEYMFPSLGWAVAATAGFVVISQLKINVTNAYAGSLAWSNFFSRLTHSHPGRVLWVVFNCLIACMLMEMDLFQALGDVLGLYSNIAIAWIMAVVADLVINKPLGLSPAGIEFKRAHLYDINPVGVGAMALASLLSIAAYAGLFGSLAQAFSALVALVTALLTAPWIAWYTRGRYYLARNDGAPPHPAAHPPRRCVVCERSYEGPDMAHCPVYRGPICSLCCTLDAHCADACRPQASLAVQWSAALRWLLPRRSWPYLERGLGHFLLLMAVTVPLLLGVFALVYQQQLASLAEQVELQGRLGQVLLSGFYKAFAALLLLAGIAAWWLVLARQSRQVAQQESRAARQQADLANAAKSRYISAISHELRTPLNSILGYAQLMGQDPGIPPHRQQAVEVILRAGEHLLTLMEGTLEMAQIESGKLLLQPQPLQFATTMAELAAMFELQAAEKGLAFRYAVQGSLPVWVKADGKRLRQVCINLLGNAIKFTQRGGVTLRVRYARELAHIEIQDTGPGMSESELARVFDPFVRAGSAAQGGSSGSGLGLTIARMLTDLMGGEIQVRSVPGQGTVFALRLFLPQLAHAPKAAGPAEPASVLAAAPRGYLGARRSILVVDNEAAERTLLQQLLAPLGFVLHLAERGEAALQLLAQGLQPDVLLLDLAMPGIDGWETLRRIRAQGGAQPAVAIVSANAFDRTLEHGLGIASEDFFVKPVRHRELLAWLQRRLQLQWSERAPAASADAPAAPTRAAPSQTDGALPRQQLLELLALVQRGYYRGICQQLHVLQGCWPQGAALLASQQTLAQRFAFEAMQAQLQEVLDAPGA